MFYLLLAGFLFSQIFFLLDGRMNELGSLRLTLNPQYCHLCVQLY